MNIDQVNLSARPPFPELVDNTMRSTYKGCGKEFEYAFLHCIDSAVPSIHLHAGGAFAAGLEEARRSYYERSSSVDAALRDGLQRLIQFYGPIEAPITKTGDKSLDNVIRAYDSYFKQYPLDKDPLKPYMVGARAMVEFKFSFPTEVMHPVTGNPILYGGRSDMIGIQDDAVWVTDEKTAGSLGEQWHKNWDLDSQFTGYITAGKIHNYPIAGAIIRGVGLLKTKITHASAIVYRADWEIERWWKQLNRDLRHMVQDWEAGYFDFALDKSSCNAYGGCKFLLLCKSPRPQEWLPINFRYRKWDPIAKDLGEKLLDNPKLVESLVGPDIDLQDLLPKK